MKKCKFKQIIAIQMLSVLTIMSQSCSDKGKDSNDTYSFNDFKTVDLSMNREMVSDDPEVVGNPLNIKIVNDSIISIARMGDRKHVILYNVKSKRSQLAVEQGVGPLEMINVCSMSKDKEGNLLLFGQMDKKIMMTKWNETGGEEAETVLKLQSPVDALRGVSNGEDGFIIFPAVSDSIRLFMVDNQGLIVDSITRFPVVNIQEPMKPNNLIFQADICYSPENNKIAIVNRTWNEISIQDLKNANNKILKAPLNDDITLDKKAHGDTFNFVTSPLWHVYSGAVAGRDSFVVGYIGMKIENDSDMNKQCTQLLEFDWDGKPLRSFKPSAEVEFFDVDFGNGYIYTIENDPDPTLYRYKYN